MSKNLTEELKRMRTLAGIINEQGEQSSEPSTSSQGGETPPKQTQSPSQVNVQTTYKGQTPLPKQPTPEPVVEEEVENVIAKQPKRRRRLSSGRK